MKDKSTSDLSQELMSEASIDQYIRENQSFFANTNVAELLSQLYEKKNADESCPCAESRHE